MLPEIQNEGRDKYGSETELKTVGKGKTACPRECCNCVDGNCLLLDNGEECKCVQLISR